MLEEASVRCPPLSAESVPSLSFCEQECLGLLLGSLKPENHSVCNNAAWAIGEVTAKVGPAIAPYVSAILQHLILIITRPAHEVRRFRLLASLGQSRPVSLSSVHCSPERPAIHRSASRSSRTAPSPSAALDAPRHRWWLPRSRLLRARGCRRCAASATTSRRRAAHDVASLPRGSSTFVRDV